MPVGGGEEENLSRARRMGSESSLGRVFPYMEISESGLFSPGDPFSFDFNDTPCGVHSMNPTYEFYRAGPRNLLFAYESYT